LNFLCQQGYHQLIKYCQILIFVFLNLSNQILTIFWAFWHPLFTVIFFDNIFYLLFFFTRKKNCELGITQKWVMTTLNNDFRPPNEYFYYLSVWFCVWYFYMWRRLVDVLWDPNIFSNNILIKKLNKQILKLK
jgi:hypothetical protein